MKPLSKKKFEQNKQYWYPLFSQNIDMSHCVFSIKYIVKVIRKLVMCDQCDRHFNLLLALNLIFNCLDLQSLKRQFVYNKTVFFCCCKNRSGWFYVNTTISNIYYNMLFLTILIVWIKDILDNYPTTLNICDN